jgi:CRISPR-associated endonuclease Cas2
MTWIFCYDIEADGLRQKIARMLEKDGWERLQKSVFAVGKTKQEFTAFFAVVKQKMEPLMAPGDKMYAWKLSDAEFEKAEVLGANFDAKWIQGHYAAMYIGNEILLK